MIGITIDNPWIYKKIVATLSKLGRRIVVRVIIDNIEDLSQYLEPVKAISKVAEVMICICDSSTMKDFSIEEYLHRVLTLRQMFEKIAFIWEIGNEVNGDWLGRGVSYKCQGAASILKDYPKAITFHADAAETFIPWIKDNEDIVKKCKYLLASEYPQDTGYRMNWEKHIPYFKTLDISYGYGECGTTKAKDKAAEFEHYYIDKQLEFSGDPNYLGGYFWWYQKDFIPTGMFSRPALLSKLKRLCSGIRIL
jgi:hypothetical protein